MAEISTVIKSLTPTIDAISKRFDEGVEISATEQSLLLAYLLYEDLDELSEELEGLKENVRTLNTHVDALNRSSAALSTNWSTVTQSLTNIMRDIGELRKRVNTIAAGVAER